MSEHNAFPSLFLCVVVGRGELVPILACVPYARAWQLPSQGVMPALLFIFVGGRGSVLPDPHGGTQPAVD